MNLLSSSLVLDLILRTNSQSCETTASGDVSTYTASSGSSCTEISCIDDYDCEITCNSHACALDVNGPNTEYDLSMDCTADNGCQRADIQMSHSENANFYINCGGLYACEQTMLRSPRSGTLDFDCVYEKTCEHFYLIASNRGVDSFLTLDLLCTGSHSCYDFVLNGSESFDFGNIDIACSDTNSCQNSKFYAATYGSFSAECAESLSCAGSELGIILNNDDVDNEIINSYESAFGTFACLGAYSCQGTTLYCPNYQDCTVTCEESISCDSTVIYCPKYGGNCVIDCSDNDQACNSIELHTYNENYEITNCGSGCDSSITVIDTTIDLSNIEIETVTDDGLDEVTDDTDNESASSDGNSTSSSAKTSNANGTGGIGLDHGGSMIVGMFCFVIRMYTI